MISASSNLYSGKHLWHLLLLFLRSHSVQYLNIVEPTFKFPNGFSLVSEQCWMYLFLASTLNGENLYQEHIQFINCIDFLDIFPCTFVWAMFFHLSSICCLVIWVVSDSVRPHWPQPSSLLHPRNSTGKNTGEATEIKKIIIQKFPSLKEDLIMHHKRANPKQNFLKYTI